MSAAAGTSRATFFSGDLTVHGSIPTTVGITGRGPLEGASSVEMVWRARTGEEIAVPAEVTGEQFSASVAFEDHAESAPSGRWALHVRADGAKLGSATRVRANTLDLRRLAVQDRSLDSAPFVALLPYVDLRGNISVRLWTRRRHVEVERVEVGDQAVRVQCAAYGFEPADGMTLMGQERSGRHPAFHVQAEALGDGRVAGTVALPPLATTWVSEIELWDLFLETGEEDPVRLGRRFDDVEDKKSVMRYPARFFRGRQEELRVWPYYTDGLCLSIEVRVPPPPPPT